MARSKATRWRLRFYGILRHLGQSGPTLIAIDDVQWLDEPSRAALEFAVRRIERLPVGVLLSLRGTVGGMAVSGIDRALPENRVERVELGPLSVAALFRLLKSRLGHPFARPVLTRIADWSGGNPLFALELGRAMLGSGRPLEPGMPPPVGRGLAQMLGDRIRSPFGRGAPFSARRGGGSAPDTRTGSRHLPASPLADRPAGRREPARPERADPPIRSSAVRRRGPQNRLGPRASHRASGTWARRRGPGGASPPSCTGRDLTQWGRREGARSGRASGDGSGSPGGGRRACGSGHSTDAAGRW